ncbi:MAG: 3-oxoacid CoA-transferase subunit B [Oscillospiraceae bacterium]|nr:3-oxoacid CoA-transferase subunit B [Oscillospiraceae bacterium]
MELTGKEFIAYRTARFFKDGDIVNLGIGMPTKCLDYLPEGVDVWIDSENGVVGLTGAPKEGEYADPNVVDAGGKTSVLRVGGACFDSFTSFGYIRGGHIDITVLGCYEVDGEGSLANWMIPGKAAAGMGGAMDLVSGSKTTIVMTNHTAKDGAFKIVDKTEMPLTGWRCVDYVVSELAVIHFTEAGAVLEEISNRTTIEEVVAKTGCKLIIPENVPYMEDIDVRMGYAKA